MNIPPQRLDSVHESRKNLSTGIFILTLKSLSIEWNGRRACNGLTQTNWGFFFFFLKKQQHLFMLFPLFIYLFVFMLLSDAKRDVLRFATAAFACAAGRSEPLESDWKDLFPALFNYVSLDAEARPPSKEEELEERRGRRRQRSTSPHETWMVLAVGPGLLTLKRVFRSSQCSTQGRSSFPLHSSRQSLTLFDERV